MRFSQFLFFVVVLHIFSLANTHIKQKLTNSIIVLISNSDIMVPVPVQLCEGAPDSTGCRQGPGVLLLHGAGAAGPDEFQRRLLHSCPCKRPGGVRSAAVRVLVGTPGPGGAAGGSHTHLHCFPWKMTEGRGLWASLGLLILVYIHMGVIYAHVCGAAAGHSSVEPGRL